MKEAEHRARSASLIVNTLRNYIGGGKPESTTPRTSEGVTGAGWELNLAPTGGFQIQLPGKAKEEVIALPGEPTSSTIKFHRGGYFYCAVCRDFTALSFEGRASAAAGDERQALSHDDFRKVREEQIELSGHAGVQFEIGYRSGMTCIRQIAVVEERLYRIDVGYMAANQTNAENSAACKRFFSSFKLI